MAAKATNARGTDREVARLSWNFAPAVLDVRVWRLPAAGSGAGRPDPAGYDLHCKLSLQTEAPNLKSDEEDQGYTIEVDAFGTLIVSDCGHLVLVGGLGHYGYRLSVRKWAPHFGAEGKGRLLPLSRWIEAMGRFSMPQYHTHIGALQPVNVTADDLDVWTLDGTPRPVASGQGGRVDRSARLIFWTPVPA